MYCVSAKCSQYYSSSDSEDEEKVLKDLVDMVGGNHEEYVYLFQSHPTATFCLKLIQGRESRGFCLDTLYGKMSDFFSLMMF